jgi:hypothetical protein
VWYAGTNITLDAGTYLYQAAPPWDNGLAGAEVHNAGIVDEAEPMRRAGRFLWQEWARGRLLGRWRSAGEVIELVSAEHDGYLRSGVRLRRTVLRCGDEEWLVVDDLMGSGHHGYTAGWLLPDRRWDWLDHGLFLPDLGPGLRVTLEAEGMKTALIRAGDVVAGSGQISPRATWGWVSNTYACKTPALFLASVIEGDLPLRRITRLQFGGTVEPGLVVDLARPGDGPAAIRRAHAGDDRLHVS